MYDNLILGFSPLTGKIYLGRPCKNKPNQWAGDKKDITSNFLEVMLQKFDPGTETVLIGTNGSKYKVTVQEEAPALAAGE